MLISAESNTLFAPVSFPGAADILSLSLSLDLLRR